MEIVISDLKPRVGSVYSYAWGIMKKYFLPLFLLLVLTTVISSPSWMMNNQPAVDFDSPHTPEGWHLMVNQWHNQNTPGGALLKIFGLAYLLFIINPIAYGAKYVRLKAVRNQVLDVKEVFIVFKNYLNVVLAALLASSIIIIGFIFLIIPGIVFACRLAFVPYLVMDRNLDPVKAVEESWRMTKGYGWKIFWMAILAFFIGIAGLLVLGIGIIVSIMWIGVAFAAMYHAVHLTKVADSSVNVTPDLL